MTKLLRVLNRRRLGCLRSEISFAMRDGALYLNRKFYDSDQPLFILISDCNPLMNMRCHLRSALNQSQMDIHRRQQIPAFSMLDLKESKCNRPSGVTSKSSASLSTEQASSLYR